MKIYCVLSLESPQQNTISQYKKENCPKLSQICNYGNCSKGPKNEFEPAVVNEPSVFEPLKFYCIHGSSELQIRGSVEDNSKIIFLIFLQKHVL